MEVGDQDSVLQASTSGLEIGDVERGLANAPASDSRETGQDGHLQAPKSFKSPGTNSRDITQEFIEATGGGCDKLLFSSMLIYIRALETGELVKDDCFSLFDAVGALEIMDPKMDSGFLAPGDILEDSHDVSRELRPEQVLGIMDALLAAEVAWHMGHPLSQTLFTSVYIDHLLSPEPIVLEDASFSRPSTSPNGNILVHVVLRSYCLALIKSCDYVHRSICAETYYEEEDFVSNLYHRSLLRSFSADDICVLVQHAIIAVQDSIQGIASSVQEGLLARLEYRIAFLRAVMAEPRRANPGDNDYWKTCVDRLDTIERTHDLVEDLEEAFSVKIQRKLASTVPPRPIIKLEFSQCITFLSQMFRNALDAIKVRDCHRACHIINFLQLFFLQKPQPAIYIRSVVQAMIFEELRGPYQDQRREFFFKDLEELVIPAHILIARDNATIEVPQDARFKIWAKMGEFVDHISEPFFDMLRALCMNRSRARRMLCNLLHEWDELQLDLEDLDNDNRTLTDEQPVFEDMWELPLSSWSYFHKLRQMQWVVQLGFELQMYHCDEWSGMYWYLHELAEHRHRHLERISSFMEARIMNLQSCSKAELDAVDHCREFLHVASEEAMGTRAQAESFAYLYHALGLLQLLPSPPPRPYGDVELRHALRLRPFIPLILPTMHTASAPFKGIDRAMSALPTAHDNKSLPPSHRRAVALLDASDLASRQARKAWDHVCKASPESAGIVGCEKAWRAGIKEILRSSVIAGIAAARIRKWVLAGAAGGDLTVQVNTGTRDDDLLGGLAASWVVPQVAP